MATDSAARATLLRLESEAAGCPFLHFLRLLAVILLGYAYPVLLLWFAVGAVVVLFGFTSEAFYNPALAVGTELVVLVLCGAFVGIAAPLMARRKSRSPDGLAVGRADAPELWALLDRLRGRMRLARVDQLRLAEDFNAYAWQVGGALPWSRRNAVTIGVPMLLAVSADELEVVLAHELAHLRGRHDNWTSRVYRLYHVWRALARPLGKANWVSRVLLDPFAVR